MTVLPTDDASLVATFLGALATGTLATFFGTLATGTCTIGAFFRLATVSTTGAGVLRIQGKNAGFS